MSVSEDLEQRDQSCKHNTRLHLHSARAASRSRGRLGCGLDCGRLDCGSFLPVGLLELHAEGDVPEAGELSVVALRPRGEGQRVPGGEAEVQRAAAQRGDAALGGGVEGAAVAGVEVAAPVLGVLQTLAVDVEVGLDDVAAVLH